MCADSLRLHDYHNDQGVLGVKRMDHPCKVPLDGIMGGSFAVHMRRRLDQASGVCPVKYHLMGLWTAPLLTIIIGPLSKVPLDGIEWDPPSSLHLMECRQSGVANYPAKLRK